jgi:ABC-type iron transport system FetAB ATPase subunit
MSPTLIVKKLRSELAGPFELTLAVGNCAAITGPSGSGKSLFLRMIADLDPNEGEVWLNDRERADRVTVHFPAAARSVVASLADRLGLRADVLNASVQQLSTGEKQRLSLVRALLLNSPVLLLDEPTGALDEESIRRVEALLQERMAHGTSILLVTHDQGQATLLGHQRYRMVAGHLERA